MVFSSYYKGALPSSEEDNMIFSDIMRDVIPLKKNKNYHYELPLAKHIFINAVSSAKHYHIPLEIRGASSSKSHKSKKTISLGGKLDLHGYTAKEAYRTFYDFVQMSAKHKVKAILVILGKGNGILQREFMMWCETAAVKKYVSGYHLASQEHGGDGAYYVFLEKKHK